MKFRKKPVLIDAITFDQLVQHGRDSGANIVDGMPWSFTYNGHAITHENDKCYLIPTEEGIMRLTPEDMLITGTQGEIYPCKIEIFNEIYEAAEPIKTLQPHQQRVIDERTELRDRLAKLIGFIESQAFVDVDTDEQARLRTQHEAMRAYLDILEQRIVAFG